MEASERTLGSLLTNNLRYEIPPYQRPYSWDENNVEQLLNDLWKAYEDKIPEYFIGSLITIELEKDTLYQIVDGQQRLTTLNLIFARLRDRVEEPAKSSLGARILPKNDLTGEEETPRLTVRKKEKIFFNTYVLSGEPITEELQTKLHNDLDAPKLRFTNNLRLIDRFFKNKSEEQLKLFADYILRYVYVVFVTTKSWESAHRLFLVLNARGMQLSNADLIKNSLFVKNDGKTIASKENKTERDDKLETYWLELEEAIGIDRMDQFFAHHYSSIKGKKPKKSIFTEFQELINISEDSFSFLKGIIISAKNYARILDNDFAPEASLSLRSLERVIFKDWIPPLLSYLNTPLKDFNLDDFIFLLEKITYQNWIRPLSVGQRKRVYFDIIDAINNKKTNIEIEEIFKKGSDNQDLKYHLNQDIYGKKYDKAILLRLEDAYQDKSVIKEYTGRITIEHILPVKMTDNYWNNRFTPEQHQKYLNSLGNITLLAGYKNSSAQNYAFDKKKISYSKPQDKISFDMTKEVLDNEEWGIKQIEDRQIAMIDNAIKIWSL